MGELDVSQAPQAATRVEDAHCQPVDDKSLQPEQPAPVAAAGGAEARSEAAPAMAEERTPVEPETPQQTAEVQDAQAAAVGSAPAEAPAPQPKAEGAQVETEAPQLEGQEAKSMAISETPGQADEQPASGLEAQAAAGGGRGATAEEVAEAKSKTPPASADSKRKRAAAAKTPDLQAMAARVKRLQAEAGEALTAAKEFEADVARQIQELQSAVAAKHAAADSKDAAAKRASQDYFKVRCEAALAHLQAEIPKRPSAPFFMFCAEHNIVGGDVSERNKKKSEMWAGLPAEEKKKYLDRYEAGMRRFNEWGNSEEGRKNLRERNELLRQCRLESKEELDSATVGGETTGASPAKRAAKTGAAAETPVKLRRVASSKGSPQSSDQALDEKVLEEASKAGLQEQLRNLASRPEVLALGKSSQELWDALKASNGMVNASKRALLGS